jgi:type II secretory ATPase GspE/PulE/Tfp pilus assembly ATPase PilB-like protein
MTKLDDTSAPGVVYVLRCDVEGVKTAVLDAGPLRIGRHADNDIVVQDEKASRFHATVEPTGAAGRFSVKDLGSRNGTRVNEQKIVGPTRIRPGDTIRVGDHTFTLKRARKRGAKQNASAPTPKDGAAWARGLVRTIEALERTGAAPTPTLIDTHGVRSDTLASDAPGARAAMLLFRIAGASRATDLHVEPTNEEARVRCRVDGQMVTIDDLPSKVGQLVIGLVHGACAMPSAGTSAVLDGSFGLEFAGERVDCRASLTPTVHGQKLVVRFLDARHAPASLSEVRMPAYMEERVKKACNSETGLVLVSGPTGSGKTTTLYHALREIDRDRRNVVTIEDPVEHNLDRVTQLPVGKANTFSELLRSVLRQDPDVILVGEIRDEETAVVAMRAAMTGHVVFSTVHARDTIGAVFRLLDLGVERYLVANAIDVLLAQRLVRLLCERCKRAVRVTPGQATRIGKHLKGAHETYVPVGCAACLRTGFMGRRAIFEMLEFNQELRDLVMSNPTIHAMREVIEQGVFQTLQQAGWRLAGEGATSLDEVERVSTST